MNVKQMKDWLETLDPETEVIIEGIVMSSNVDKDSGMFYEYKGTEPFSTRYTSMIDGKLYIGIDL